MTTQSDKGKALLKWMGWRELEQAAMNPRVFYGIPPKGWELGQTVGLGPKFPTVSPFADPECARECVRRLDDGQTQDFMYRLAQDVLDEHLLTDWYVKESAYEELIDLVLADPAQIAEACWRVIEGGA